MTGPLFPNAPRILPRVALRGEAELIAIDQGRPQPNMISVQLQDLAWGGFGFLCSLPLEIGSRWRALFLHGRQQVGEQTLMIRHCREIERGLFRAGAQVCVDNGLVTLFGVDWHRLTVEDD